ncbi:MAG: 30S ribosome-binding factor RbfA [Sphingobacteriales bacterium]|jgi:ribosome-binding factor A|nr:MAG: 30S ribosome-binding factor RbfA [Sphingobacteriales bacterium]
MESKRQNQVSKLIQINLSEIFQRDLSHFLENALVSISNVFITPDLYICRVYLSIFNHPKPEDVLKKIQEHKKQIRGILGNKIRNKMRTIPEIEFYLDDTIDEIFKIESILKEVKEKDESIAKNRTDDDTAI